MSAAHLAEKDDGLKRVALTHREEAVSRLEREVLRTDQTIQSIDTVYSDFNLVVLFICILLGMTDSWHNPTMLGLKYLHSARLLFKRLSPVVIDSVQSTKERNSIRFIAGIMAYWEALVSFLKDQPLNATSYLSSFVDESYDIIPSNPWTGVSTPLFIYLARVGALGRQRETMQKLNLSSLALDAEERIQATLTKKAREIEMALLGYRIPPLDKIEQTHDIQTPVIHLQKTAQIFRLTALLEVYLSFPELFTSCAREFSSSECDSSYRLEISRPSKMLSLATGILTIISTLPLDSGTNVILCLPLIVAGSALQYSSPASTSQKIGLFDELANIHNEQGVHEHWRSFVRERLKYIHRFVGLASVLRALEVVERTWFRADVQRIADKQGMSESFVHWTNVMVDERLETIFG
ncbi:hypothetical protein N7481_005150 [Penicillium waksmanii]|uniref:uncharacterized protein n=1 Tax=Penicillium waksmanii TaxID=69791 RepID=UPI002546DC9F|nr:uncharacterized protein N7481_005150 [Penicillium waksmanii]KAJ5983051.1 hypothetical protein N7481_005150 [Penicillium waksmanii]